MKVIEFPSQIFIGIPENSQLEETVLILLFCHVAFIFSSLSFMHEQFPFSNDYITVHLTYPFELSEFTILEAQYSLTGQFFCLFLQIA